MKIEQKDLSLLFSSTNLPDVFFTEHLSQMDGNYAKIYLYLVFLSKYNKDIKINDLSKKLELPLKVIQDAIKYLEDHLLIIRKNQGFIINDLQELELNKLYKPRITSSPEEAKKSAESQYRAKAIEEINNRFFQGVMSPSWYTDIDLWFKKYSFDEEVMLALFQYCFNKSAMHRNYIQAVADTWSKNNIRTFNDLDMYYQKQEKLHLLCKDICKKLRLNRSLTTYEEAYVEKWSIDYGYSISIIEVALRLTTSKSNISFTYLDKLLTDWNERGFKTVDQINQYLVQTKEKNKSVKEMEKKNKYNNYEQRAYTNLNDLYSNIPPKKKA